MTVDGLNEFVVEQNRTIEELRVANDDLYYVLEGVMHSVDKWLSGDELQMDAVNRASIMREKTLCLVEKLHKEIEQLKQDLFVAKGRQGKS